MWAGGAGGAAAGVSLAARCGEARAHAARGKQSQAHAQNVRRETRARKRDTGSTAEQWHMAAGAGQMLSQGRSSEERDGQMARTFSNRQLES